MATSNTIAFWLKLGDISQMDDTIYGLPFTPVYHIPNQGMYTYRSLDIIHDYPYPGYSLFRWWVYPQFEWIFAPTVYFENQWVHFAIVYDQDRGMSYYLNGMHIGDGVLPYDEMGEWAGFVMGRITRYLTYDDGTYEPIAIPMNAAVDDLALYNFALSPEEVLELVYHGAPDGWLKGNFRDQIHVPDEQQKAAFEALFSPKR